MQRKIYKCEVLVEIPVPLNNGQNKQNIKIIKFNEENIENLCNLGLGNNLLCTKPKAPSINQKIKQDFIVKTYAL